MTSMHITAPPLSEQSMADLLCTVMVLCQAKDTRGNPFWAYMCIKPSMAKAFKDARDSGNIDLQQYGTIIEWGQGDTVPDDTRERMERDFGVNHDYERDLVMAIDAFKDRL